MIDRIQWPADPRQANSVYLGFVLAVVERLHFRFSPQAGDPVGFSRRYLAGLTTEAELVLESEKLWRYLDEREAWGRFSDPEVVNVRFAMCVLPARESKVQELGERLSWFFEMLDTIKAPMAEIFDEYDAYFAPYMAPPP